MADVILTSIQAHNSCVLTVSTVVDSDRRMRARHQCGLVPTTRQVVQPYVSRPGTEARDTLSPAGIAELTAGYLGVTGVPAVITHRAPAAVVEDLDSTLVRQRSPHKPDII